MTFVESTTQRHRCFATMKQHSGARYNADMKPRIWLFAGLAGVAIAAAGWFFTRPAAQTTVAATESPLAQAVVFSGRVASLVRVELGATITGRIAEVLVREGDRAATGQLLARLDTEELQAQFDQTQASLQLARARVDGQRDLALPTSQAALAQAAANLEAASLDAKRTRELFTRGFIAQARVDETERAVQVAQAQNDAARASVKVNAGAGNEAVQARLRVSEAQAAADLARARLQQTRIVAPADGRVVLRSVDPGQIVQPGKALFQYAVDGSTLLIGQADEKFLNLLARGQQARVVADAFASQPFEATIASIAPGVDAQRGTVEVKFVMAAPPAFLREDMTLSLQVQVGRKERALTLPAAAVLGSGIDAKVRVIADGRAVDQRVKVGLRTLDRVEIIEGLKAGALVLAEPLRTAPGARVRVLEQR